MSDSNERKFDSSSADSESSLEKLLRKHGINITEQEFDEIVEKRYHGVYSHALKDYGITKKEYENMGNKAAAISQPESSGDVRTFDSGVSVNLGERALHLLAAGDEYSKFSQLDGFEDASHSPKGDEFRQKYGPEGVENIIASKKTNLKKGDQEFHKAFGSRAMIKSGEDPVEVDYDEQMQANKYKGIHIITQYDDKETRTKKRHKKEKIRNAFERQI